MAQIIRGLPFGPHPHRGFETLTFVLQGDITHKDSVTGESVIKAGGIQWMTAGSGLIHAEISSDEFKQEGRNGRSYPDLDEPSGKSIK